MFNKLLFPLVVAVAAFAGRINCSNEIAQIAENVEDFTLIPKEVYAVPTANDCQGPAPCCFFDSASTRVDCYGSSSASAITTLVSKLPQNQYQQIFLHDIQFSTIPDNIFGVKAFREISIQCSSTAPAFQVTSVSAFAASKDAIKFELINCNSAVTSFDFLGIFQQLEQLVLQKTQAVKLHSLPQLPMLSKISISGPEFREWHTPSLTPNLRRIEVMNNNEENTLNVLQSLVWYAGLEDLKLANDSLKNIPQQLKTFSNLRELYLGDNLFTSIQNNSFHFSPQMETLGLHRCPIETIEAGSFDGIYGNTSIALWKARLNSLDRAVFQQPLAKMLSSKRAFLGMNGVILNCSSLYWLLCDNRQYLPLVKFATCQGTSGVSLQQYDHSYLCPRVDPKPNSSPSIFQTHCYFLSLIALLGAILIQ